MAERPPTAPRWLRELVDGGGGDVALSAEREVAPPHRAFGHGPYSVAAAEA